MFSVSQAPPPAFLSLKKHHRVGLAVGGSSSQAAGAKRGGLHLCTICTYVRMYMFVYVEWEPDSSAHGTNLINYVGSQVQFRQKPIMCHVLF